MQMSLDGFVSTGPNDEQKWVTWAWEEIGEYVLDLFDSSDTILIGRKLAVDYIPYWQEVHTRPNDAMYEVSKRVVRANKIVFTKTLNKSEWHNTEIATGNMVDNVRRLKNQPGKDLIVYGGTSFVSALVKDGLVDEFHLFVNPVILGKGESIFYNLDGWQNLKLKNSITYNCGIVLLNYVLTG